MLTAHLRTTTATGKTEEARPEERPGEEGRPRSGAEEARPEERVEEQAAEGGRRLARADGGRRRGKFRQPDGARSGFRRSGP